MGLKVVVTVAQLAVLKNVSHAVGTAARTSRPLGIPVSAGVAVLQKPCAFINCTFAGRERDVPGPGAD